MSLVSVTVPISITNTSILLNPQFPRTHFFGNFTSFMQAPLGLFCIADGGASAIDASTCVNPVAKPFFITGAVCNLGAGLCMAASFSLGYICVPAAVGVGVLGTGCRRIGCYAIKAGNRLEVKPTLSKATTVASNLVENPLSLLGKLL